MRVSEIIFSKGSTADDVIHMEGEMRAVLMNQAIFAKAARPLENEAAQAG